jgi:biotin carboxylase
MKKLAILGASQLQIPLIEKARELGVETHVFAWEEGAVAKPIADYFYPVSIIDKVAVLKQCAEIKIDGIVTVGSDVAVDTINFVAKELHLVGNSDFTSRHTRDKQLMRSLFAEKGLPTVRYKPLLDEKDILELEFDYPFMVKATDRSGSRGVTFVNNADEAKSAFNDAVKESFNKKVIAEEFFDGTQYSVEMISQHGKHYFVGITEEFYSGKPFFVETGHIVPGKINEDKLAEIIEIVSQTLDAVEMQHGASHTEIRMNEAGKFCLIEIASRMGGDFRDLMVLHAYGYDFLANTIRVALDELIEIPNNSPSLFSFVKWIFDEKDLIRLKNLDDSISVITSSDLDNIHPKSYNIKDSSERLGFYVGCCDVYPLELVFK